MPRLFAKIKEWPLVCPCPYFVVGPAAELLRKEQKSQGKRFAHTNYRTPEKALKEIRRIQRKGGRLKGKRA